MTNPRWGQRPGTVINPSAPAAPRPGLRWAGGSGGSSATEMAPSLEERGQQSSRKQDGEQDEQGSSAGSADVLGAPDSRPQVAPVARPPALSGRRIAPCAPTATSSGSGGSPAARAAACARTCAARPGYAIRAGCLGRGGGASPAAPWGATARGPDA